MTAAHVLPKRIYYTIFVILILCTYLTVQIAFFDLGALNTIAAIGIAIIKASRARALIRGRHYVVPDDLYALAEDVLLHRMRLNYEALADGKSGVGVLQSILHELSNGKPR